MYIYPNCGFDVTLLSGFERVENARGTFVRFQDLRGLHAAIAAAIVDLKRPLTKFEFRFLRKQLDLSQREVGDRMKVTEQVISLWERGRVNVPFLVDVALRQLVSEELGLSTEKLGERLARASAAARAPHPRLALQFEFDGDAWINVTNRVFEKRVSFRMEDVSAVSQPSLADRARAIAGVALGVGGFKVPYKVRDVGPTVECHA